MNDPFDLIADERRAFADTLETLTPEQWATPSLCGEWTVKEVAAHVTVGPTASIPEVVVAMVRSRMNFDRANVRLAAARAAGTTDEIVASIRDHATSRFTPPTFDWHAPLSDLFIHRLDCLVPLDLATDRPVEPWLEILPFLRSAKATQAFTGARLPEVTLAPTDLDWSEGTGPVVEGPAEAIGAVLCRRPALLDRLTGPGVDALRAHATA